MSRADPASVDIRVRLTPRAGRDEVVGVDTEGVLRVRVAAPPVDGEANRALLRVLAAEMGVPASAVRLVAGATGRTKRVRIAGLDAAALAAHWPGLSSGAS